MGYTRVIRDEQECRGKAKQIGGEGERNIRPGTGFNAEPCIEIWTS